MLYTNLENEGKPLNHLLVVSPELKIKWGKEMKSKIISILVCMLMVTTVIVLIKDDSIVEASDPPEGPVGGLDLDYIWNKTLNLSNIIYTSYHGDVLRKGRAMGSDGAKDASRYISDWMDYDLNLTDVHTEQLQNDLGTNKNYHKIIEINDYQLTINNTNYPYDKDILKNESFYIGTREPFLPIGETSINHDFSYNDLEIVPINMTKFWPLAGTYNNFILNIIGCFIINI